jgi:adhesin transport system membrane fusion protein
MKNAGKLYQDAVDLEFMDDVEAALRNRGSRWAYGLSIATLLFFVFAILWMHFTERDEVTRGTGQVTPSLGVQPIQSEAGGVVERTLVKEGQEVKKGDKLVQMSNIEAVAEYKMLLNRQVEAKLAIKRLDAEEEGRELVYSPEETAAHPQMVGDQMRLFTTRRERQESGTREIEANIEQKKRAVEEALTRKRQHERNLTLLREQVNRLRPLVQQRIHSEIDFLNLRQRVVSTEGELNSLAEVISRTQSEVREEEARLANRDKEWMATISKERNEYRQNLEAITQRLTAGSHRVEVTDLRAPMTGVIRRILVKEGGVAQRAEPIMELLPTDDTLEVDARFAPQYRGYLKVGLPAEVKVDAYDFTIHGSLPAEVTRISPDTIEDNRGQAWFEVRLRTKTNKLHYKNEEFTIKPGMTVTVDVIAGKKSVLSYILKPFLRGSFESNVAGGIADKPDDEGKAKPAGDKPADKERG